MRTYFSRWKLLGGALVCLSVSATGCNSMGGGSAWPSTNWFSWAKKSPEAAVASRPTPPSTNALPSPTATAAAGVKSAYPAPGGAPAQPGNYPPSAYGYTNPQAAPSTASAPSGYHTGHYNVGSAAPQGAPAASNGYAAAQNPYARGNPSQYANAPYQAPYGQASQAAADSTNWNNAAAPADYRAADTRASNYGARGADPSQWSGGAQAVPQGNYQPSQPVAGAAAWNYDTRSVPAANAGTFVPPSSTGLNTQAPAAAAGGAAPNANGTIPARTPVGYRPGSTNRSTGMSSTVPSGVQPASYNRSDYVPNSAAMSSSEMPPASSGTRWSHDRAVYPAVSGAVPTTPGAAPLR